MESDPATSTRHHTERDTAISIPFASPDALTHLANVEFDDPGKRLILRPSVRIGPFRYILVGCYWNDPGRLIELFPGDAFALDYSEGTTRLSQGELNLNYYSIIRRLLREPRHRLIAVGPHASHFDGRIESVLRVGAFTEEDVSDLLHQMLESL